MEELIKKHKGQKSEDQFAFYRLSESDQERVGEVLNKVGIIYASNYNSNPQSQRGQDLVEEEKSDRDSVSD